MVMPIETGPQLHHRAVNTAVFKTAKQTNKTYLMEGFIDPARTRLMAMPCGSPWDALTNTLAY